MTLLMRLMVAVVIAAGGLFAASPSAEALPSASAGVQKLDQGVDHGLVEKTHGWHCKHKWGGFWKGWGWHHHKKACKRKHFRRKHYCKTKRRHCARKWGWGSYKFYNCVKYFGCRVAY